MLLPALFIYLTVVADLIIFVSAAYYFFRVRLKEKNLREKENAVDTKYHHMVDEALAKERQILGDATLEADKIITGAQYVTHNTKESVSETIRNLIVDIQKEEAAITRSFVAEYQGSLKKVTTDSLAQFQQTLLGLQKDLQKQITDFHESLLPGLEKEIEAYKKTRLQEIDKTVIAIAQKASEEILNKSFSPEDHQELIVQALEKAKREGIIQ